MDIKQFIPDKNYSYGIIFTLLVLILFTFLKILNIHILIMTLGFYILSINLLEIFSKYQIKKKGKIK